MGAEQVKKAAMGPELKLSTKFPGRKRTEPDVNMKLKASGR